MSQAVSLLWSSPHVGHILHWFCITPPRFNNLDYLAASPSVRIKKKHTYQKTQYDKAHEYHQRPLFNLFHLYSSGALFFLKINVIRPYSSGAKVRAFTHLNSNGAGYRAPNQPTISPLRRPGIIIIQLSAP